MHFKVLSLAPIEAQTFTVAVKIVADWSVLTILMKHISFLVLLTVFPVSVAAHQRGNL